MSRADDHIYELEEQGRRISRLYRRWDEAFQATAALTTAEDRVRLQERLALVATALREYEEAVHWEDTVPSSAELVAEISAVRREVDRLLERTP